MKPVSLNIRTKLFLILSGLTIVVLLVVLTAVNRVSSTTIRQDIVEDFAQLQSFFRTQQSLTYDRHLESAILLAENSTFKANVSTKDSATVYFSVLEYSQFAKADIFIVTDDQGSTLAWFTHPEFFGRDLSHRPNVSDALQGIPAPLNPEWADLWYVDDKLYQTATEAIYGNFDIMGTITVGSEFKTFDALMLKENIPVDVTFFHEEELIASSIANPDTTELVRLMRERSQMIDSVTQNLVITDPLQLRINGVEHLAFISPLGRGERAYYLASTPLATQLGAIQLIEQNLLLIGFISVIGIIPVALFLGNYFSNPIKSLTDAMVRVQDGDLDINIEAKTNDEVGTLTRSFNQMVVGLRERFALTKYVGDHTLRMIQQNTDLELEDAGSRQTLAILFTDIRGSTSKIANTSPEKFISMLNKTLSQQSDAVLKHRGSIDKFVGDSLIALFAGTHSLDRAIKAAIDIQKSYRDDPEVSSFFEGLGIGVNYGSMILGNMGAKERLDYTVIGQEVNLCARLCHEANPGQILMAKELINKYQLEDDFQFSDVENKELKGFSSPIKVVEVIYE